MITIFNPIFLILLFVFGLIIGSFLNVVIFRFNTRRSFFSALGGRSGCMTCQNQLLWYELLPVFSFLGLRGRCRNCKTKISIQYPLVEILTGFLFVAVFLRFQSLVFFLSSFRDLFIFGLTYAYYGFAFFLSLRFMI